MRTANHVCFSLPFLFCSSLLLRRPPLCPTRNSDTDGGGDETDTRVWSRVRPRRHPCVFCFLSLLFLPLTLSSLRVGVHVSFFSKCFLASTLFLFFPSCAFLLSTACAMCPAATAGWAGRAFKGVGGNVCTLGCSAPESMSLSLHLCLPCPVVLRSLPVLFPVFPFSFCLLLLLLWCF